MPDTPPGQRDAEITRLRRRLRTAQKSLREARTELATRPPAPEGEDAPLTAAEIEHLEEQFKPNPKGEACRFCSGVHRGPCETCGGIHAHACPRIRSVQYQMQGDRILIRKVTYWKNWDREGVMFPDEIPAPPG